MIDPSVSWQIVVYVPSLIISLIGSWYLQIKGEATQNEDKGFVTFIVFCPVVNTIFATVVVCSALVRTLNYVTYLPAHIKEDFIPFIERMKEKYRTFQHSKWLKNQDNDAGRF